MWNAVPVWAGAPALSPYPAWSAADGRRSMGRVAKRAEDPSCIALSDDTAKRRPRNRASQCHSERAVGLSDTFGHATRGIGGRAGCRVMALRSRSTRAWG